MSENSWDNMMERQMHLTGLWNIYNDVVRQIDMADRKASFVITFQNIHLVAIFLKGGELLNGPGRYPFLAALILVIVSLSLAVLAVRPRVKSASATDNVVSFLSHTGADAQLRLKEQYSLAAVADGLHNSITVSSRILSRKYGRLGTAFSCVLASVVLSAVSLLLRYLR
jgi:hypothetical protein